MWRLQLRIRHFRPLSFCIKQILDIDFGELPDFKYAKKPRRLPVVLTQDEVKRLFDHLNEPYKSMVGLMYGAGLRLNECLSLRILDVDFGRSEIIVRAGKGNKDRRTLLPEFVVPGLKLAIQKAETFHQVDQQNGIDYVTSARVRRVNLQSSKK